MAKETKLQVWTNVQTQVQELLTGAKSSKKFSEELLNLLESHIAPKKGGGSINPPKLDEDGNIVEAYCRFHNVYYTVDKMVISGGKSKGYCKAAISLWNKTNSRIKKLDAETTKYILAGQSDEAMVSAKEAEALRVELNNPSFYNIERDWDNFNVTK